MSTLTKTKPTRPKVEMYHAHMLITDSELYPRHHVDESHVASLVEALRSGATLPPIVADRKSKKVVDGWHRLRAYCKVYGDDTKVPVIFKDYPSKAAMVKEAVELNVTHGLKLQRIDRIRSAHMLKDAGLNTQQIAVVLRIREGTVHRVLANIAYKPSAVYTPSQLYPQGKTGADTVKPYVSSPSNGEDKSNGSDASSQPAPAPRPASPITVSVDEIVPLKRAASHFTGKVMTPEQQAVHARLFGIRSVREAVEVLRLVLDTNFAPLDDEALIEELKLAIVSIQNFIARAEALKAERAQQATEQDDEPLDDDTVE